MRITEKNLANVVELANRRRALKASVADEASLVQVAMRNEVLLGADPESVVLGRYADELARLWGWEAHLEKRISNEYGSGLPKIDTDEPDGTYLPRTRQRLKSSLRDELNSDGIEDDPIFDLIAEFFGVAAVLSVGKISQLDDPRISLVAEIKKRLKAPSQKGGGTSIASVTLTRLSENRLGRSANAS